MAHTNLRIVPIDLTHLDAAWALWLRALGEHPDIFGSLLEEVMALDSDAVRTLFDATWNFRDNRVFGLLADTGEVVGLTGITRLYRAKMQHRVELWGIYVTPAYRGRGLGAELFAAALDYCRMLPGVLQVHLEVISSNAPAIRSYSRAGFVQYGRIPRADIVDGTALDCDLMVLMLDGYPVVS